MSKHHQNHTHPIHQTNTQKQNKTATMSPEQHTDLHVRLEVDRPKGDDEGSDIYDDIETGLHVLFQAVKHNQYDQVAALVAKDAALLDSIDEWGNSLLHMAVQNDNKRMARMLLQQGRDFLFFDFFFVQFFVNFIFLGFDFVFENVENILIGMNFN